MIIEKFIYSPRFFMLKGGSKMVTKEQVMEALKNVYDPEIGVSVVDLGLIYDVKVEDEKVYVKMTLTTIGCPLALVIPRQVEDAIRKLGVKDVEVELTFDPPWNPSMMSEELRKRFGFE